MDIYKYNEAGHGLYVHVIRRVRNRLFRKSALINAVLIKIRGVY